jgi:hypothetical protein
MTKQPSFYFHLSAAIFSEAGYNTVHTPLIYTNNDGSQNFLSLAFDDSGQKVWITGFNLTSADMEDIVNKTKKIIHESIDDFPIYINAVLIQPADKPNQTQKISYEQSQKTMNKNNEDSYILIFDNLLDADDYIVSNKNQPVQDTEHLPASYEYYETIVKYLNTRSYTNIRNTPMFNNVLFDSTNESDTKPKTSKNTKRKQTTFSKNKKKSK